MHRGRDWTHSDLSMNDAHEIDQVGDGLAKHFRTGCDLSRSGSRPHHANRCAPPSRLYAIIGSKGMSSARISRKHHFVPRCYLARFTDSGTSEGRLCVFDLAASRLFQEKPKNVAKEIDFNRVDIEGQPPDVLESAFGELVEAKAASVIRQICDEDRLPGIEEFSYVLNLITLLAVRHPVMRRAMTAAKQAEYHTFVEILASNRAIFETHLKSACEAGFVSRADFPFERMQEFVRRGNYTFEIGPHHHLRTELGAFEHTLRVVGSRYWSLWSANAGTPDLITCDRPVSLVFQELVFPLDTRHCIIGARERAAPPANVLNDAGVAEVNSRMVRLADRQVYSRASEIAVLVRGRVAKKPLTEVGSLRG
jgi:hypothetical protein